MVERRRSACEGPVVALLLVGRQSYLRREVDSATAAGVRSVLAESLVCNYVEVLMTRRIK